MNLDFAVRTFGPALDLDTICDIGGVRYARYEDRQWRGWIPLADLARACTKQDEIETSARKAADKDDDYAVPENTLVWQKLHDLVTGIEDAHDE